MGLLDMGARVALAKIRDNMINPKLEGIAKVTELDYKDKKLFARVALEGVEEIPLEVTASKITAAPDGSSITIGEFQANRKFMQNALDKYVTNKPITIPEVSARIAP